MNLKAREKEAWRLAIALPFQEAILREVGSRCADGPAESHVGYVVRIQSGCA